MIFAISFAIVKGIYNVQDKSECEEIEPLLY